MNNIVETLSGLPAPYSDLTVVVLLFIAFYLIGYIISKLSGAEAPAAEEKVQEAQPEAPEEAAGEVTLTEAVEPEEVIEEETQAEEPPPPQEQEPPEPVEEEPPPPLQEVQEEEEIIEEVHEKPPPLPEMEASTPEGLFSRLRQGLSKTHTGLFGKLEGVISKKEIDTELWDEFEETLISSDIGVSTTMKLREKIEESLSKKSMSDPGEIISALKGEIHEILKNAQGSPTEINAKPTVIMVAGVNGVGKTTTIGKLANNYIKNGSSVMVAACDTFRAAAIEQLEIWSNRVGSDFIKGTHGADPSAVAFDALSASKARGTDILIIDTAGRLHTKTNLMDELKKIKRILGREMEDSPHEVLIVLDATTGQNAIQQAKTFDEAIEITGIVLTKLDGTAKGGVIIAIADELNIPVKYIGIGESLDDLREFNANEFVEALFISCEEQIH